MKIHRIDEEDRNDSLVKNIDYHVHSSFSDGFSHPLGVVQTATERGILELCFTDHYSTWKPALLEIDFEEYFHTIEEVKKGQKSNNPKVFIGIEVDLSSISTFSSLEEYPWDLILFEYVFSHSDWEKRFFNILNFQKNHPQYKIGLAHTRFTRISDSKIEFILEKIREHEIIIELNTGYGNYMDRCFNYLDDDFWYSIGSDAHHEEALGTAVLAMKFLKERNIPLSRVISL